VKEEKTPPHIRTARIQNISSDIYYCLNCIMTSHTHDLDSTVGPDDLQNPKRRSLDLYIEMARLIFASLDLSQQFPHPVYFGEGIQYRRSYNHTSVSSSHRKSRHSFSLFFAKPSPAVSIHNKNKNSSSSKSKTYLSALPI
jgi:hypothetical protein